MTRARALLSVSAIGAVVIAALVVLIRNYGDAEMYVYVSVAQAFSALPESKEIAYLGSVSACHAKPDTLPKYAELIQALQAANAPGQSPRSLERLSNIANVVRFDMARDLERIGVSVSHLSKHHVLRLSRVGFNRAHTQAILCIEAPGGGWVLLFEEADGPYWRQTEELPLWIS
jgi:hypothetical protein